MKLALFISLFSGALFAEVKITTEQQIFGDSFAFENIPIPATNDLGNRAKWRVISGKADPNSGAISALNDGKVPTTDDEPRTNFFFKSGSDGGLVHVDLGEAIELKRITSYSRHFNNRGPQIYDLYASRSDKAPTNAADLGSKEWIKLATVNTRDTNGPMGGRHAASLTGKIGFCRQLVFEIKPTEKETPFGLTFFSEIDIIEVNGPDLNHVPAGPLPKIVRFATKDNEHSFAVDITDAPQYEKWVKDELSPVILEWYPKIVDLLPGKDYEAPAKVTLKFKNDVPKGVPAYATGSLVTMNAPWFKNQLMKEAKGCVVHELVHVVQNYWLAPRLNPNPSRTPSWVTEGLADYIRWFLFEPESKGAHYTPAQIRKMKHDASYRISANFIDWVSRNYKEDIASLINNAARNGRYDESLWKKHTGISIEKLAKAWKSQ
ncbi:basic secretory family protein [bacterium]|nr:basic secretory family protein [bacterium]